MQHNQHKTLHNPGYVTLIILLHPLLGGPCHPKVLAVMEDRLTIPSVSLLFSPLFPELFFILQHVVERERIRSAEGSKCEQRSHLLLEEVNCTDAEAQAADADGILEPCERPHAPRAALVFHKNT